MTQLTLRGFDEELEKRLREFAGQEGTSLNKAALKLLRRGAGLETSGTRPDVVGHSLDMHFGTWTAEQAEELLDAVKDFEQIDESFWK